MALLKGTSMGFFRNPWAIVLLIVLVILLFGANKLPGLARNMGKSMRIFKSEVEELRGEDRGSEDGEDEDERPARSDRPREERRAVPGGEPAARAGPATRPPPTVATEQTGAHRVVDSGSGRVIDRARSAGRKQIRGE